MDALTPAELVTDRLRLEPLRVDHAPEMVEVLADQALYGFTGGEPPSLTDLERRYTGQAAGSGDPAEQWLNWIVRLTATGQALGYVQATVEPEHTEVAWTIGAPWQGNGYAREATVAMADWLRSAHHAPLLAWIHPDHVASHRVAQAIGLALTDEVDDDGEHAWRE